jgi:hypothetical protein
MITNRWLYFGLPLTGVIIAVVTLLFLSWRSKSVEVDAACWFDDVTFELSPYDVQQIGGPLVAEEQQLIRDLALEEVRTAYADLRLRLTRNHSAFYTVRIVQDLGPAMSKVAGGAAGETHVLGPFGGSSRVSFLVAARGAFAYAPAGATRQVIVEGIGRGIGRTAVHEFEHQILGPQSFHSADERSYEYGSPDRIGQYYGPIHWSDAWLPLQAKLGR